MPRLADVAPQGPTEVAYPRHELALEGPGIAQLLAHRLIRGSFVPPAPIRELRNLTRYRKALIQEWTRAANRLHKALEDAGVKLVSVASDILGVSGRAMLEALVQGTTDAEVLADLARGTLRRKLPALRQALSGRFRAHHGFLVAQILGHLDSLDGRSRRSAGRSTWSSPRSPMTSSGWIPSPA